MLQERAALPHLLRKPRKDMCFQEKSKRGVKQQAVRQPADGAGVGAERPDVAAGGFCKAACRGSRERERELAGPKQLK